MMERKKQDRIAIVRKNLERIANKTISEAERIYQSFFSKEMPSIDLVYDRISDSRDTVTFLWMKKPLLSLEMEANYRLYCWYKLWGIVGSFHRIFSSDRHLLARSLAFICYIAAEFSALEEVMKNFGGLWRVYQYDRSASTNIRFASSKFVQPHLLVESVVDFTFIFDRNEVEATTSIKVKPHIGLFSFATDSSQGSKPEFSVRFSFSNNRELQNVVNQLAPLVSSLTL